MKLSNFFVPVIFIALFLIVGYLFNWVLSAIMFLIIVIIIFIDYLILKQFDKYKINKARRKYEQTKERRTEPSDTRQSGFRRFFRRRNGQTERTEPKLTDDFISERPRASEPFYTGGIEDIKPEVNSPRTEYREDKERSKPNRYTPI